MTEVASSNNPIVNNKLHRSSSVLSNNGNSKYYTTITNLYMIIHLYKFLILK